MTEQPARELDHVRIGHIIRRRHDYFITRGHRGHVTAVELDAGYVRAAQTFPWLWASYRTARVVVEEGRYFLEQTRETYDMVIYAYIDPQSGISKLGIPDANFLYTDAGIRKAYARLRPGGYFVMNRVYLVEQDREFFAQLCATLQAAGSRPASAPCSPRGSSPVPARRPLKSGAENCCVLERMTMSL